MSEAGGGTFAVPGGGEPFFDSAFAGVEAEAAERGEIAEAALGAV
ncbi:MAG: hypothetical protein M0001_12985 [Treponema sp.]|nr:hypothetical protein [Treponema sp.]